MTTTKFYGTIEFLSGQHAAIISLTSTLEEWSGASRIDLPRGSRADLYEAGYARANQSAILKGGFLERFTEASA
jgi:hypothetical protein